MYSHLTLIVLSIVYLVARVQCVDNTTIVAIVVQNVTVIQNVTVVENTTVVQTTVPPVTTATTMEQTTVYSTGVPSNFSTTPVLPKAIGSAYVEPPPHPLGYCIRSRIMCSKIRRCCRGPCNLNNMRCP